jgi:hypothetical protein
LKNTIKCFLYKILLSVILLGAIPALSMAQTDNNTTAQPQWGPAGYQQADYYYLPDVESYYSVASRQFIYLSNGRWLYSAILPNQYKKYDLYSGYKVIINRPRPFLNFSEDKVVYAKYKNQKNKQVLIRDAHEANAHILPVIIKPHTAGDFGPKP